MTFSFDRRTCRLHVERESDTCQLLPWPGMLAFRQARQGGQWVGCRPDFPLLAHANVAAVELFSALMPERARAAVRPFPSHHWHILAWMARAGRAAEDLAVGNPALAFMLASAEAFDGMRDPSGSRPSWAYLLFRKQVRSLDRLGFPPTEQTRRMLRKIAHRALRIERLQGLRPRLRCPQVAKRLSHLPRLDATVLDIAVNGALVHAAPRLLEVIATETEDDGDAGTAQVLIDTVRMWRQVRRSRPVPEFQSLRRLHAEHERLIDDMNVVFTGSGHSGFPPPPVAGTDYIMPILTLEDLIAEGREQRNCVVSLASRIRSGSTALYRVLAPERCTLSLVQSGGTWTIGQLEASCNSAPSRGTRDAIRCWLRQE